jgi:glycosyltransferase involved in cell wall biosynthesis
MARTSLEITIPILNEERVLEQNVQTLLKYLNEEINHEKIEWKIVIADNGSSDGSHQIMDRLCQRFSNLHYLRIDRIGVGIALKTSWSQSEMDIVGYMDVDLATSLTHIKEMLTAIIDQNYDFVYGSRLHQKAIVTGRSLKREIVSRIFNTILRNYLKVRFSDGMCGFKFLRRPIALRLIEEGARSDGWFFSTELLYLAEKLRLKIFELPIEWKDSRDSKVNIGRLSLQYLKAMYRMKSHAKKVIDTNI